MEKRVLAPFPAFRFGRRAPEDQCERDCQNNKDPNPHDVRPALPMLTVVADDRRKWGAKNDPFLENIRGEPRFKKLMERVKREWENFEV